MESALLARLRTPYGVRDDVPAAATEDETAALPAPLASSTSRPWPPPCRMARTYASCSVVWHVRHGPCRFPSSAVVFSMGRAGTPDAPYRGGGCKPGRVRCPGPPHGCALRVRGRSPGRVPGVADVGVRGSRWLSCRWSRVVLPSGPGWRAWRALRARAVSLRPFFSCGRGFSAGGVRGWRRRFRRSACR